MSGQRTFTDGETQPLDAAPLVRALRRGEVLARSADGRVFGPGETEAAAQAARRLLGEGSVTLRGREVRSRELAPYAALSALLPLGLVLWRRNLR